MKIAIIGGGASGFFSAINCKLVDPQCDVVIFEKTNKLLSKVLVSGGGRCNVTNSEKNLVSFSKYYPRGEKKFREMLKSFSQNDMVKWLNQNGVSLKSEPDGRVFPISDSSQTIVDCFLKLAEKTNIEIKSNSTVTSIKKKGETFSLSIKDKIIDFDKVIVAIGGSNKKESYQLIADLGHNIIDPVPSLFTFNIPNWSLVDLMGVSVQNAKISLPDLKLEQIGPLIITHWGLSGPAVIKLSAWGAKMLFDCAYQFRIKVSWVGELSESEVLKELLNCKDVHSKAKVMNTNPFQLS
ncbi:MAG: aminoacetone oxidase family FAD-binding enzyme, partial [Cytophagales bacterium]